MNVLHLDTEKTWRGGQNQTLLLARGLKKLGHHSFFAIRKNAASYQNFFNIGSIVELVELFNVSVIFSAIKLSRFCKSHHIDIIDCQSSRAHLIGLLTKYINPKVGLVVHRRVDYKPSYNFISKLKYMSPKVSRYIAISNAIKSILIDYGIDEDRIAVAPSAVDESKYLAISREAERQKLISYFGLDNEAVLIGNASAFTSQKGYDTLIKSLAKLDKQKNWVCLLAGDGELLESIKALAKSLGLAKKVIFLGHINNVPEFLSGLDILAVSSNYEGLGTIILDGIYAGCAVCATRVGGIPEMILHEETGLLSAVGDAAEFSHNLGRLFESREFRGELNTNARDHIRRYFSLERMVEANVDVYTQVLNSR